MRIHARAETLPDVLLERTRRHGHNRNVRSPGQVELADSPGRCKAVHDRHADIHENHIEALTVIGKNIEGLLAVPRGDDFRAGLLEYLIADLEAELVIVDQQDPSAVHDRGLRADSCLFRVVLALLERDRQLHAECDLSVLTLPVLRTDLAVHSHYVAPGDDESKTDFVVNCQLPAAPRGLGIEDGFEAFRIYAAVRLHGHAEGRAVPLPVELSDVHDDRSARGQIVERVRKQIPNDLGQSVAVGQDDRTGQPFALNCKVLSILESLRAVLVFDLGQEFSHIYFLWLKDDFVVLDLIQVDDVLQDAGYILSGRRYFLEVSLEHFGVAELRVGDFRKSDDRVDRCADVAAESAEQGSLCK